MLQQDARRRVCRKSYRRSQVSLTPFRHPSLDAGMVTGSELARKLEGGMELREVCYRHLHTQGIELPLPDGRGSVTAPVELVAGGTGEARDAGKPGDARERRGSGAVSGRWCRSLRLDHLGPAELEFLETLGRDDVVPARETV